MMFLPKYWIYWEKSSMVESSRVVEVCSNEPLTLNLRLLTYAIVSSYLYSHFSRMIWRVRVFFLTNVRSKSIEPILLRIQSKPNEDKLIILVIILNLSCMWQIGFNEKDDPKHKTAWNNIITKCTLLIIEFSMKFVYT